MPHTAIAYIPLTTYPEAVTDQAILAATRFAAMLGYELHVSVFSVDIPQVYAPLGGLLLDVPGLVRAAEEKSRAECQRLRNVLAGPREPQTRVTCSVRESLLGTTRDIAAAEARYYDCSFLPWSGETVAVQDISEAVIFNSGRPAILVPPSTRPDRLRSHRDRVGREPCCSARTWRCIITSAQGRSRVGVDGSRRKAPERTRYRGAARHVIGTAGNRSPISPYRPWRQDHCRSPSGHCPCGRCSSPRNGRLRPFSHARLRARWRNLWRSCRCKASGPACTLTGTTADRECPHREPERTLHLSPASFSRGTTSAACANTESAGPPVALRLKGSPPRFHKSDPARESKLDRRTKPSQ